jgi:hypothetical protein
VFVHFSRSGSSLPVRPGENSQSKIGSAGQHGNQFQEIAVRIVFAPTNTAIKNAVNVAAGSI